MPVNNNADRAKRVLLVIFFLFVAFFVLNLGAFSFFTFMVLMVIALLCFRCSTGRTPPENDQPQGAHPNLPLGRLVIEPDVAPGMTAEQKQELLLSVIPSGVVLKTSDEAIHADFGNEEIVEIEPSCPVCLVEFEHSENVLSSPSCKHVFHNKCILEWVANHNDCPICRRQFVAPELLQQPQPVTFSSTNESNNANIDEESPEDEPNSTNDEEAPTAQSTDEPEIQVQPDIEQEPQSSELPMAVAVAVEEAPLLPVNPLFPSTMTADQRISKLMDMLELGEVIAPHRFAQDDSQAVITCEDANECPICHKDFTNKESLPIPTVRSPNPHCRHIGCRECMTLHLIHTTNCGCPTCGKVYVNETNNYPAESDADANQSNA